MYRAAGGSATSGVSPPSVIKNTAHRSLNWIRPRTQDGTFHFGQGLKSRPVYQTTMRDRIGESGGSDRSRQQLFLEAKTESSPLIDSQFRPHFPSSPAVDNQNTGLENKSYCCHIQIFPR